MLISVVCDNPACGKEFQRQHWVAQKNTNNYCSRSCGAINNNRKYQKRKRSKKCKGDGCDKFILSGRTYCRECSGEITRKKGAPISIQDLLDNGYTVKSNAFAVIRYRARVLADTYFPERKCFNCGYDKHVEVCHIKPISEYPLETLDTEINKRENLVHLCPNCHWEFDHNNLQFSHLSVE